NEKNASACSIEWARGQEARPTYRLPYVGRVLLHPPIATVPSRFLSPRRCQSRSESALSNPGASAGRTDTAAAWRAPRGRRTETRTSWTETRSTTARSRETTTRPHWETAAASRQEIGRASCRERV